MQRSMMTASLFLLSFSLLTWSDGAATGRSTDWDAFSRNLVKALATPNDGLQQSAMQMVIQNAIYAILEDYAAKPH